METMEPLHTYGLRETILIETLLDRVPDSNWCGDTTTKFNQILFDDCYFF